jgi:hypothetical protein
MIEPGERTGSFRVGDKYLLTDDSGESVISTEDFAVALVNELEEEAHECEQFTVAYSPVQRGFFFPQAIHSSLPEKELPWRSPSGAASRKGEGRRS